MDIPVLPGVAITLPIVGPCLASADFGGLFKLGGSRMAAVQTGRESSRGRLRARHKGIRIKQAALSEQVLQN